MADPATPTAIAALIATVGQLVAGLFKLEEVKTKAEKLAKRLDDELPELKTEYDAHIKRLDEAISQITRRLERRATGSQPALGISADLQSLRERIAENDRRFGELRSSLNEHVKESRQAWQEMTEKITDVTAVVRTLANLPPAGGRHGGRF